MYYVHFSGEPKAVCAFEDETRALAEAQALSMMYEESVDITDESMPIMTSSEVSKMIEGWL